MSRPISYTSAVTLTPTGYTNVGSYAFTSQTIANAYTDADSTTSNRMTLARSSNSTRQSQLYYNFETSLFSEIPSYATINSVVANVKYYINSTTAVTAVSIQLHSNTTAKGSAITERPTTGTKYALTTGNWTLSELQNARLYVSATHNASSNNGYLYFYGADLTVNYAVNGTEYEVSFTNTSPDATTDPNTTQYVFQGESQVIKVYTDYYNDLTFQDNGVNKKSSLVNAGSYYTYTISNISADHAITIGETSAPYYAINASSSYSGATVSPSTQQVRQGRNTYISIDVDNLYEIVVKDNGTVVTPSDKISSTSTNLTPSEFLEDKSTYSEDTSSYPPSNGVNSDSGSTSYCMVSANTGTNAESRLVYKFDCSLIPRNAVIESVTCSVRGGVSSTSYLSTRYAQLYCGETAKGNQSSSFAQFSNWQTPTAISFNGGSWTREELDNINIRMIVRRGTSNTTTAASFRFYGASLNITYSVPATYNLTNIQTAHTITVEEATYITVSTANTYAGATITANPTKVYNGQNSQLTLTVANLYEVIVKDNGAEITNSFTGSNGTYRYTLTNPQVNHSITVEQRPVYSMNGLSYTENADIEPFSGSVYSGQSYVFEIYGDITTATTVTDNGVDVTSELVEHEIQNTQQTFSGVPVSYDTTNSNAPGFASGTSITSAYTSAHTSTSIRAGFSSNTTTNSETNLYFNFDCSSIPQNAIIDSVTCDFAAAASSAVFETRIAQLCYGTTKRGTAVTITNYTISNGTVSIQTISNGGSWTREELNNIKLLIQLIRGTSTNAFYPSFMGATLRISYHLRLDNHIYWTYSLSSVTESHTVIISEIIEIPEEDPQYEYYPITISSINASTTPGRGTTRVVEGTNQTIEIHPSDPVVTLITDNGVDVTNQLVAHGNGSPSSSVTSVQGASYGFNLNNNTGYYVSQNEGVSSSAALCRATFNLPVRCLVTIKFINYAESTYDFGLFSKVDTALATTSATDASNLCQLICNTSTYNTASEQTLTYEMESGEHFIDIKFKKDNYTDSNNDNLQWKVESIQELESNNYYTYTLSNIQSAHSLIFIFGDVTYYFVNSNGTGAKLFPSGYMVELPGDSYILSIVPDSYDYDVSITDNNVDATSSLQKVEQEITKNGETYTVVNYVYTISNVQATHNLVVTAVPSMPLYTKINGTYIQAVKVYHKVSGAWVEVDDPSELFDATKIYIRYEDTTQ